MSVKNLPYQYYSLPYCRPAKIVSSAENLGEVLRGDRIENSPYDVSSGGAAAGAAARNAQQRGASTGERAVQPAVPNDVRGCRAVVQAWGGAAQPPPPLTPTPLAACTAQTSFRMDQFCSIVCRIQALNKAQAKAFTGKISDEYRVNMWARGRALGALWAEGRGVAWWR